MATDVSQAALTDRFVLKAFVEACLVLEEGVSTTREIDLGMMAGTGLVPPPFARADATGLDQVLAALERAEAEWGERFAPPTILRRLVSQGRLGQKTGQGFFPYPRPDADFDQGETVKLETRPPVAIAWLDRPPANSIAPQVIDELTRIWGYVEADETIHALVIASANPLLWSAGADIKAFRPGEAGGGRLVDDGHALLRAMERSSTVTIAAVNAIAYGGGCELAMGCDIRLAAQSATFGQPEIDLGILPGLGGTQRLARLVGESSALELNLSGRPVPAPEALELGLVHRVVADHELFDTALRWARGLGGKAPLARGLIKRTSAKADLDEGIAAEKAAFAEIFATEDAREGIGAFLQKRTPRWSGR
jgi:enoyl-CoA hydratase/3-hydroxyacyl-CoA dehydrogenase